MYISYSFLIQIYKYFILAKNIEKFVLFFSFSSISLYYIALANKKGSTLFRHEIAYVLGQMQAKSAIPRLLSVLADSTDDPIVRHEVSEVKINRKT